MDRHAGEFFCLAGQELTVIRSGRRPFVNLIHTALRHLAEAPVAVAVLEGDDLGMDPFGYLHCAFSLCKRRFYPDGVPVFETEFGRQWPS